MIDSLKDKVCQWLLSEAASPLLVADAASTIVLSNPAAQALFGYSSQEFAGLSVESLVPEHYRGRHRQDRSGYNLEPGKRLMKAGRALHARRKDGSEFVAEVGLNPMENGLVLATIQDVTERKRVEDSLHERQARLERTEEIAHLGSWELDLGNKHLAWSDEVYRIFGLQPREFAATYEAFLECVHPDDRVAVDAAYSSSLRENRDIYEIEHRIVRQDSGEVRIVHEKCQHFRDKNGRIVRSVGMIHDITERKQAEASLLESEAALKEAQHLARLGTWKWNLRTGVHYWSEEIFRIYGRDPSLPPAVYPEVRRYFTPASWDRLAAKVEQAMAEGRPYVCDAEVVRPDGSHRWVLARGAAAHDPAGNIIYLHGTVQDITERKQAEEALRESESRYRELVQNANSAIIRWSRDGTITFFNEYAQSFFGWRAEEAIGRHVGILLPERESTGLDLSGLIQAIVENPQRYLNNVNENVCRDGRRVWMTWSNHAILDEHGQVSEILAVGSDITERKRSEAALQAMRDEMEQVTRFQVASQTVSALAHELNQPLNAVTSYAEAALRMLRAGNPQPDKLQHAIEHSAEQAQRAGKVVRELLTFMRQGEVQTEAVDLNELVRDVLGRVDREGHGGFRVHLELAPGLAKVRANRLQVEKVLVNLIRNGVEAMHDAGISVRSISLMVRTDADGVMAQVTVRDTGPGIDAHTLHRIFDPFFTTKPGGLGMGLAISRAIIESHGGQLWVESEPGSGASFHLTLPFVE